MLLGVPMASSQTVRTTSNMTEKVRKMKKTAHGVYLALRFAVVSMLFAFNNGVDITMQPIMLRVRHGMRPVACSAILTHDSLLQVEIGTDEEKVLEFYPALTNCNQHDLRIKSLLQLKARNVATRKQVWWTINGREQNRAAGIEGCQKTD